MSVGANYSAYEPAELTLHLQARIVIDEVHLAYTTRDYRAVMAQLSKLVRARPPVALLTATCGPSMQRPLLESLGLDDIHVIRADTARPEITYLVSPAPPTSDKLLPTVVSD